MSDRGADLFAGGFGAFVGTLPWIVAAFGWGAGWNAYINLFLTLGGGVILYAWYRVCKEA